MDGAAAISDLLERRSPEAARVRVVCDHLHPHGCGSLYEAYPPEKARKLAKRLEIHATPTHGSWLHIAAIA